MSHNLNLPYIISFPIDTTAFTPRPTRHDRFKDKGLLSLQGVHCLWGWRALETEVKPARDYFSTRSFSEFRQVDARGYALRYFHNFTFFHAVHPFASYSRKNLEHLWYSAPYRAIHTSSNLVVPSFFQSSFPPLLLFPFYHPLFVRLFSTHQAPVMLYPHFTALTAVALIE